MDKSDHLIQHQSSILADTMNTASGLRSFFSEAGFMPHGHCYLWKPSLMWTHFISDLLIGIAYFSISITLYFLVRKIRLPFSLVVLSFGVFIGACGLTHLMEVWTLWYPDYWISGGIKVVTATASVGTGIYLYRLRHPIITVAEAAKLSEQRRLDLEALTKDLERRVDERTLELERSRAELLEVTNALPSIVTFIGLDHHYRMVNETFESWVGVRRENAIGKHVREVVGDSGYESIKPYLDRASKGEKVRFQTEFEYKAAGHRYVQINYVPKYKDGALDGIIGLTVDQTSEREHQLRAQKLAIESERDRAQLKAVFNAVTDGIAVSDMDGNFVYVNDAQALMNGYPNTEVLKKNMPSLMEAYEFLTLDNQVLPRKDWPISKVLRGESIHNWELRGRRKDTGQEWYFSFSGRPVIDHLGKQFLALVVTRDITLQKKNELAQIESLEQFKTMANSISQLAWMADSDGQIFWYNDSWYRYTGTTPEKMRGLGWQIVHDPSVLPEVVKHWRESIKSGHDFEMEFPMKGVDGRYRLFLTRARPIRDAGGNIIRWFGTNTDIEEQRKAREFLLRAKEEAEAANAAKSQFLANMSHELRTPMTAVLGFTDLLKNSDLSEEERLDALERIDRSGKSLMRLIDDVLDISKIEAGKIEIQKSKFSPVDVLMEVASLLRLQAEQRGTTIRVQIDPSLPEVVFSDPARLRQILTNLIGNAVKFTENGEIVVTAKSEENPENKIQYLLIDVSDTGIGIREKDKKKLFQPFAQADQSITRKFGGTGLGLVLSKRLAQELNGDLILAKSEVGKGSCFRVKIEAAPFQDFPHRADLL